MNLFTEVTVDQWLMIACILVYGSVYISGIVKGTIKPVLSGWLIIAFAWILSLSTTFGHTGRAGLSNNMYNLIDEICTLLILLSVLLSSHTDRRFDSFEWKVLASVLIIGIAWYLTAYDVAAHIMLQIILLIAYIPLLRKLRWAHYHKESLFMRSINALSCVMGMIRPAMNHDMLPLLFTARWLLCTLLVIYCLLKIENQNKHTVI